MFDDDGRPVDATFSLESVPGKANEFLIVFESRGGTNNSPSARNSKYNLGLRVLLERLGRLKAHLVRCTVDSLDTRHLPIKERQLRVDGARYPVDLYQWDNYEKLRLSIGREAKEIGRAPDATGDGNRQKRLKLRVRFPPRPKASAAWLKAELTGKPLASSGSRPSKPGPDSGSRSAGGQGRSMDPKKKDAIEAWAMKVAQDYFESAEGGRWKVIDKSKLPDGYDLSCARGSRRLRVEVKGTTTLGKSVLLTKNEVKQAAANPEESVLFVVYGIQVKKVKREWQCEGGRMRILYNWNPREQGRLQAEQFKYFLPADEDS